MKKFKKELNYMEIRDLQKKIEELRREYFSTRLNAMNVHIKDYSRFGKLRKKIACVLTFLQQKNEKTIEKSVK